jgi:hypothetical protein
MTLASLSLNRSGKLLWGVSWLSPRVFLDLHANNGSNHFEVRVLEANGKVWMHCRSSDLEHEVT